MLRARAASQLRNRVLDSKRKKLKDELEEREKKAREEAESEAEAASKLANEIERLRKEGSKQLEQENEILKKQIEEEMKMSQGSALKEFPRLKVKSCVKGSKFTDDELRSYFSKFGTINALVLNKKGNSAIIELTRSEDAMKIFETKHNFNVEWISGKPLTSSQSESQNNQRIIHDESVPKFNQTLNDNDFESLVLRNLRQAEERKRLIKQMEEEES